MPLFKSLFKCSTDNEQDDEELPEYGQTKESLKHSKYYSKLLDLYINSTKWNTRLKYFFKLVFFLTTMGSLIVVVWFFGYSIVKIFASFNKFDSLNDVSIEAVLSIITMVLPAISSLIVAFIKIPEIIAQYLFNIEEDNYMDSIIKNIQDHDKAMFAMEHKIEESLLLNKEQFPDEEDEEIKDFDEETEVPNEQVK